MVPLPRRACAIRGNVSTRADQWLLYIRDDKGGGSGALAGWQLIINYVY